MALYELNMPQMGESIYEATVLRWMVNEGEEVRQDDIILEVATDKVDSEIPSPVSGIVRELKVKEGDEVSIGSVIAVLETKDGAIHPSEDLRSKSETEREEKPVVSAEKTEAVPEAPVSAESEADPVPEKSVPRTGETEKMVDREGRFFSPLVRTIAEAENISAAELRTIEGTGAGGKVTKADVLAFLGERESGQKAPESPAPSGDLVRAFNENVQRRPENRELEELVEMTRVRATIARHMMYSLGTAAHATSVAEADMTRVVQWRERNKKAFLEKYGVKLTYTPVFMKILAGLLREYPYINASVQEDKIVLKKYINIGVATALPDHTLIVPVVKNTDQYNIVGLAHKTTDLVSRARSNDLKADEIQGGTFTLTNIGTFGNLIGTPIINQPEVAILATGAIVKKPSVIETSEGDYVGIRHKMYLSLSFDHRIIDGYMGGTFLKAVTDALESFDEEDL